MEPMTSFRIAIFFLLSFSPPAVFCNPGLRDYQHCEICASEQCKFAYFVVPKTGSRSVIYLLRQHLDHTVDEAHNAHYNGSRWKGYFKFAFVRNPWDRLVSCYMDKAKTAIYLPLRECWEMTFEEFVEWLERQDLLDADIHIRPQISFVPTEEINYIARFENFNEDILYIFWRLGVKDFWIPRWNATTHGHYSTFYSDRTRDIVGRIYQQDIEAFGYQFEECCENQEPLQPSASKIDSQGEASEEDSLCNCTFNDLFDFTSDCSS
jgi:Sulfotransferase family